MARLFISFLKFVFCAWLIACWGFHLFVCLFIAYLVPCKFLNIYEYPHKLWNCQGGVGVIQLNSNLTRKREYAVSIATMKTTSWAGCIKGQHVCRGLIFVSWKMWPNCGKMLGLTLSNKLLHRMAIDYIRKNETEQRRNLNLDFFLLSSQECPHFWHVVCNRLYFAIRLANRMIWIKCIFTPTFINKLNTAFTCNRPMFCDKNRNVGHSHSFFFTANEAQTEDKTLEQRFLKEFKATCKTSNTTYTVGRLCFKPTASLAKYRTTFCAILQDNYYS